MESDKLHYITVATKPHEILNRIREKVEGQNEEILILEDDVVLCKDFKVKLMEYKNQLPDDWQYTFVGHCCLPPKEYQQEINSNVITCSHPPMCTHAYMIKKSSIPILLETNSIAWAHIDIQIQKRSLKRLKHYVFIPPLAEQKSLNSEYTSIFKSLTWDWNHHTKS